MISFGEKIVCRVIAMIGDYHQGGGRMIDTECLFQSIKAAWEVRFINASERETWNVFANYFLQRKHGDNFVFCMNFINEILRKYLFFMYK